MPDLMSILQAKAAELQSTDSSSTPVAVERTPVMARLSSLMEFITFGVKQNPGTSRRAKFFMDKIVQEAMTELDEAPPEIVEDHFQRMASAMYWVATGNVIQNMDMPEGFWDHIGAIPNEITGTERLSIEAGTPTE
jgi:hypothetical protein